MKTQKPKALCFDYGHRYVGDIVSHGQVDDYLLDRLGIAANVSVESSVVKISVMSQQSAAAVMRLLGYSHEYLLYHAEGSFSFQIAVNLKCKHGTDGRLLDT